jgi:hypothetical protein
MSPFISADRIMRLSAPPQKFFLFERYTTGPVEANRDLNSPPVVFRWGQFRLLEEGEKIITGFFPAVEGP